MSWVSSECVGSAGRPEYMYLFKQSRAGVGLGTLTYMCLFYLANLPLLNIFYIMKKVVDARYTLNKMQAAAVKARAEPATTVKAAAVQAAVKIAAT